MKKHKATPIIDVTIADTTVKTVTGIVNKNSKAEKIFNILQTQINEKRRLIRIKDISHLLMKEHEIPKGESSTLANKLCGSAAKTNEKEVFNWVSREVANIIDDNKLYESELIEHLSRKLWDILEELSYGYC